MPEPLAVIVQRVSAQVRWRRAEYFALRALFYGLLVAVGALVLKAPLRGLAAPLAVTALGVAVLAGAIWGLVKRVPASDAARLADRAFGLQDRIATALEWSARADRTPLVEALVADATARAASLTPRQIVNRRLPREARWLPLPFAVALVVMLAPPVPLPSGRLPDLTPSGDSEEAKERGEMAMMDQRRQPLPRDEVRRSAFEERDFAQRAGAASATMSGDLSAVFKDTSIASQRPDFNSFLKKGDDRLRMLEQADRLPDLQSDYTASQYKMVFRRSKELTGGLRPDQISPQKLRELFDEMERLGRKNSGNWGSDVNEGMEALEGGQNDRAMDAMEKALNKMRAMEERDRSGKSLKGGRDASGKGERGRASAGGPEDQDFGEGEGSLPGKGKSGSPKGEPTQRIRANPYDVGVEGESRRGKKDSYDTNMTGKGGQMGSRLGYLGVIGQYRKLMEDSIAREQVPRDLHGQIKDYFQALEER